jgi:Zn-dependent protease with chaperone function
MRGRGAVGAVLVAATLLGGCAVGTTSSPPPRRTDAPSAPKPSTSQKEVDPAHVARLKRTMLPLLAAMDRPRSPGEVKVGIIDDPAINAANAGDGEFYVTTGLLQKANDDQLLAIMAHEVAHEDLGHVAKQQALGTGVGIGAVILDQIIPGAGRVVPVAGALIQRSYSRNEEYAADRHGVDLLQRVGRNKDVMISTLTWLKDTSGGDGGGGFLSTHPATSDRIDVLRKL